MLSRNSYFVSYLLCFVLQISMDQDKSLSQVSFGLRHQTKTEVEVQFSLRTIDSPERKKSRHRIIHDIHLTFIAHHRFWKKPWYPKKARWRTNAAKQLLSVCGADKASCKRYKKSQRTFIRPRLRSGSCSHLQGYSGYSPHREGGGGGLRYFGFALVLAQFWGIFFILTCAITVSKTKQFVVCENFWLNLMSICSFCISI